MKHPLIFSDFLIGRITGFPIYYYREWKYKYLISEMQPVVCISTCKLCLMDAASVCLTQHDLLCLLKCTLMKNEADTKLELLSQREPAFLCLAASPSVWLVPSPYLGLSREQIGIIQLGQMSTKHGDSSCCRWTGGMSFSFFLSPSSFSSHPLFRQLRAVITYLLLEKLLPMWNESIFTCLSLQWDYLLTTVL